MKDKIKRIFQKLRSLIYNADNKDETQPSLLEIWKFQIKFLKIKWSQVIQANVSILIQTLISARQPFVIMDIKKTVLEVNHSELVFYLAEFFIYQLIRQILQFYESKKSVESFQENVQLIQQQILSHIFTLDMDFFESNKVSQLTQIISQGSNQLFAQIQYNKILQDINIYILYGGQFYFIYCQSPFILFTMIIISFMSQVAQEIVSIKQQQQEQQFDQGEDFKSFAINDILNNIHIIKSFGTESKEINTLNSIINQNSQQFKSKNFLNQIQLLLSGSTSEVLCVITVIQIFLMKSDYPEQSKFVASNLVEILGYSYCTIYLAGNLIKLFRNCKENSLSSDKKYIGKLIKLFQLNPTIDKDYTGSQTNNTKIINQGNIQFINVSFKYPETQDIFAQKNQKLHEFQKKQSQENNVNEQYSQDHLRQSPNESKLFQEEQARGYVLKNVNFEIKQGQCVAFVGMSGSGKSTIIKLIERFYDSCDGTILIDGQNIKDIPIKQLRKSIGLVNQEPSLFDNSILYNITYGCDEIQELGQIQCEQSSNLLNEGKLVNPSNQKINLRTICDVSGVSEFVFDLQGFPQGLLTLVGSKGMKLSGGQKQRVAIARALMINPSILILDEATSSLDAESEQVVQRYIDQLIQQRGMTIIIIAHRLSTVAKSDKIFVMQNGEIKETGNHADLLEQNGIYKQLVNHQINFEKITDFQQ